MKRVEWENFIEIKESTIEELLLEFLSSFTFYKGNQIDFDREDTIVFRLEGLLHSVSISDFRVKSGFYDDFLAIERYKTSSLRFSETILFLAQFW